MMDISESGQCLLMAKEVFSRLIFLLNSLPFNLFFLVHEPKQKKESEVSLSSSCSGN
jgi:hypothetical protein